MPICACYSRVSTSSPEQLNALAGQQERLAAAVPDGYTAAQYIDILSGTNPDRPEFNRLMSDVAAGSVQMVIATRIDRLSRNRLHSAELLDLFSEPDAPALICLDDQLDLRTVSGRLMAGVISQFAISESDRLGERVRHGQKRRRKQNKPFGPTPPQGLLYNDERDNFVLDPEKAEICQETIKKFLVERKIRPVMRWANENGLDFASASAFTRWIQNPSLAGARTYGVSKKHKVPDPKRPGKTKTIRRHNKPGHYEKVIWDSHPALITRETHEQLIAFFAGNRSQAAAPYEDGRIRIATGLSICGMLQHDGKVCGKRLSVHQSSKGAPRHYRCINQKCTGRYINRVKEDDVIATAVTALQEKAKELSVKAANLVSRDDANEPDNIVQLRSQIEEAKGLNNPRLADAITEMEAELEVLLRQPRGTSQLDMDALEELLAGDEVWADLWENNPAHLRDLLKTNVFGVLVERCQIMGVRTRWG